MHSGQLVFAQLMDFLPRHEFNTCVRRHGGDRRLRGFSCRAQFLCLAFAQLTFRESLRDIETCLRALGSKLYHAGFRGQVSRSTLAEKTSHDRPPLKEEKWNGPSARTKKTHRREEKRGWAPLFYPPGAPDVN